MKRPAALHVPPDFERFITALVTKYRPEKVILFGSRARGEERKDSDVDLLVVMDHDKDVNAYAATDIYMDLRPSFAMDMLVRRPKDIIHRMRIGDHFIRDIFTEGIVLHDSHYPGMD